VFSSGVKEVFRVRLASGREVEATANHPFLTVDGWCALGDLAVGDRVATPRRVPAPVQMVAMPDERVVLLAHLIGDGSFVKRQPLRYASTDEANLEAVEAAASHEFGSTAVRDEYAAVRVTTMRLPAPYHLPHGRRNPIAEWLDELGLFGLRSYEKFVPAQVFSLSHVAVPFPAWDPLYGPGAPEHPARELSFATLSPRGERKVLAVPLANLMRITWNPFYPYLETRVREWIVRQ
jgi:replicative DNA helicase